MKIQRCKNEMKMKIIGYGIDWTKNITQGGEVKIIYKIIK